ncbi:MAG: ankyrin repeat domain-containing protein [Akkermansia sp.]|nr:ankyrin repeat domain-containing protein [Akkermansia sp.]
MKHIYATALVALSLAVGSSAAQPELPHAQQLARHGITPEQATEQLHQLKNKRYRTKPQQYLAELEALLEAGANPNIPNSYGESYMFYAAFSAREPKELELVLKYGGDVHARDKYGNTPLHHAYGRNTELLLAAGSSPNAVNNDGAPVITHVITEIIWRNPDDWPACIYTASLTVSLLLQAGADANAADAHGNTALHYFLQGSDNADIVSELIAKGANINARNKDGATPLMLGATQGWSKTLDSFLKNHAPDLNARDYRGLTAMHYAAEHAGTSPTTIAKAGGSTGNAPEDAILLNNIAELKHYITAGGNVNAKGTHGSTLLHWAAACGHTEITAMLLQAGAEPNAIDDSGFTPLQYCFHRHYNSYFIHEESLRLLLEAGSNPNVKARDNDELLIFAAARNAAVLEHMLRKGISPDIKDSEGTPLIFHATSYRYTPDTPVKVLLNAGVDIFAKNAEGKDVFEADLIMEYEIFKALDEARQKRRPEDERQ